MASIIRIKRSSTSGNPGTLGAGELAYSALSDNGSNGGDRLYIGMGVETSGNAVNHIIVGGKYYTGLVDAGGSGGTLNTSAKSIPVLSATGTIDKWYVGNLYSTSNTISATNTNGGITLTPNGTGYVTVSGTNGLVIPSGTTGQQGPSVTGAVRFNTTTTQYEGYNGTNWTSLGGVRSVDGLTYIIAESSPGASDDILHFYAATGASTNVEVAQLNSTKLAILQTTASSSSTTGALTVAGGVGIAGDLYVGGNLNITGTDLNIGSVTFNNGLTLSGSSTAATEYFRITNGAGTPITTFLVDSANGNTTISGTLGVTGATTLSSTLGVTGDFAINTNKFNVTAASGNTTIAGTLGVTGASTLASLSATTGSFSSTLGVTGDFAVNTNKFNVTASSGNTTIAGTLGVTGATTLSSTLDVTGNVAVNTNKFTVAASSGNTVIAGTLGVTGISTFTGAVTANGGVTASGAVTVTAGGSNTNINLVPQGTGTVDVGSKRITSVAEPTQSTDAATKNYVDAVKTGLDPKDSVRIATTAALTATYSNGSSGVGATLTNSGTQAAFTVDSIVGVLGDRVLVKDQASALQNGIYTITTVGTVSTNWVLTRATDADQNPEVTPGAFTFVEEGTNNGNNGYVCTSTGTITIGTSNITWVQFSGAGQINAGDGLTKTGNRLDVVGTANRITANADSIDIASTYVGQTSITTLGTIGTGTWQGTIVNPTYGGTGVNNGANTITVAGNVSHAGAFTQTFTATGNTSVTLPTTGTLATLAGTETFTNKTLTSPTINSGAISGTFTGSATLSGVITLSNTTDATNTTTAGVVMSGGLGIAKSVYVGLNITGAGAATSTLDGFNIDGGTY
jgi:hypothetical protein